MGPSVFKGQSPDSADVVKLRELVQFKYSLGITEAQDYCAALLHTARRSWQHWERGERKMHPSFWELIQIKLKN